MPKVLILSSAFLILTLPGRLGAHGPYDSLASDPANVAQDGPPAEGGSGATEDGEGKEEEEKDEDWDVDSPPGPSFEVELDVTAGTWMSLDLSPDGEEIVFDLLGDLYLLPIEGGEATSLTSGVSWDMQPRFSPDGRWIAFTSDRGGGDNLWIVGREGSEPRQVTKEDFRLLNSPVWSPDGQFLAARKHFTSRRSLGAGEIWLYHRSGGDGLQMIERPNDQKDLGEPAFSPEGRYLYYSLDSTPGDRFEYNKDPNTEIYTIRRLDRETGEVEEIVGGPGGAVRPTPSPDGRFLAFVRRRRTRSVLFVKDLVSGEERPLYDGLDRDMQETWAVHGVYPTFAWTPDSRAMIFWAGGGFHRLEVESGEVAGIPFHLRDTRTVAEPVRFPVEVHPESFETKMLRWVQVSPAGDRVVFQALGRLWVRELPDGPAHPLTRQTARDGRLDHFEIHPSFSRDGKWVVFATWDDRELGSIRMAPAGGGKARKVTSVPGHYLEPVFSPDGSTIIFRRAAGGFVTSPTWSVETGIYRLPVAGGEAERITKEGVDPHFGADPERVFLRTFEAEGRRALTSIELDGKESRKHLTSENATEIRISPDGRWVAFREGFKAFVAPFVATGKAIEIGPATKSIPVREVSDDAGEYLHWSGDSRTLLWALGPDLFTLEIAEALDFLRDPVGDPTEEQKEEEDEEKTEPGALAESRRIGFETASDRPEGTLALVGGRVITLDGDEVIEEGTVIVKGNRIAAVGASGVIDVPAGAEVIDVAGKTLIPGLVDVHWHGNQGRGGIVPEDNWINYASLAFGVTTLHDPSNDTATIFAAAELARAGMITAPRIFSTGTILYGAKSAFKAEVDSLDDAEFHLRRLQAVGAFSVKSYNQPRRDQRQQVIAAARDLGMMVVPEGGSLFQHNMTMVVDGHTGIEHSIPVARIYQDVHQLWSATRVGYTPTLVVGYGGLWGENYWYAETPVWENERLLTFVPREIVDRRARRRTLAPDEEWGHFDNARVAAELSHRGVLVNLGAHGQREGLAAHWELWMFAQGGMSPLEALRAASLNGAVYLGLDGDIGSIEEGKLADLVVLSANPLDDIRNTEKIDRVVLNGRLYDAATLDELAPRPRKRPPFFWQLDPGSFTALGAGTAP